MKAFLKFFIAVFFLLLCRAGYAQSTLEYATLLTRQAATGANKEKGANIATSAVKGVYGDSAGALSRGSALLQQAGQPAGDSSGDAVTSAQPPSAEPEDEPVAEDESENVKVYLESGQVIEGKLIERGDDYVKVESNGIVVTYFNEEIDKVS